jgi:WD40 repeat protein
MDELPTELVSHVLSFVPSVPQDLYTLSLVCRLWHQLTRSSALWKGLNVFPSFVASKVAFHSVDSPFRTGKDTDHIVHVRVYNAQHIITIHRDSTDKVVFWANGGQTKVWEKDTETTIFALCFWRDMFAFSGRPRHIHVWSLDGNPVMMLSRHSDEVYSLLEWNTRLYSASYDKNIEVWDQKGNSLATLRGHKDSVNVLMLHNNLLYSGSSDGEVMVWNFEHQLIRKMQCGRHGHKALVVWNNTLYCGGYEATVRTFSLDGVEGKILLVHEDSWTPFLKVWEGLLCSGGSDGGVYVWNYKGQLLTELIPTAPGHSGRVTGLEVWQGLLLVARGSSLKAWRMELPRLAHE